jgi:hypothetical protein
VDPSLTVPAFDVFLAERGLRFDAVVIGGAALVLLRVIARTTYDVDVLDPRIPPAIANAAEAFATSERGRELGVEAGWLNSKSHDFVGVHGGLPDGWRSRVVHLWSGQALTLHTLARPDLLATKLVAFVDRGTDAPDVEALRPGAAELLATWPFVRAYDSNPKWPAYAKDRIEGLARELGIHVLLPQ